MAQSVIEFRQDFIGIISSSVTSNGANFGTVVKADLILGNKMDYLVYLILSFIYIEEMRHLCTAKAFAPFLPSPS